MTDVSTTATAADGEPTAAPAATGRVLLLALTDSEPSQLVFDYVMQKELSAGDMLHIVHVVIDEAQPGKGVPRSDYFQQSQPAAAERVELAMLRRRFLHKAEAHGLVPTVHIVPASLDGPTVGRAVCVLAARLNAAHVYVGVRPEQHKRSRMLAWLGSPSVCEVVKRDCSVPVTVVARSGAGDVTFVHGGAARA
jgi:Universal stress protein family